MPEIATGVFKKVAVKRQAALNVKAPAGAAGTARYLRRVTSTLDLAKASFASAEINTSQQVRDLRHGVRSVAGSIAGELSAGGYQLPIEGVLRQAAVAGVTSGAVATIASAVTVLNRGTFTRGAGSFIADGFKVGDIVRASGYVAPAVANNAKNMLVIALTALVMTVATLDGSAIVAKAAGDPVVLTVPGRKVMVPQTGQQKFYHTIEHFFGDIAQSEQYVDCVFTGMSVGLPPSGMATISFPVMGLNMETGQVEYFTAPAAAPTGPIMAAVNGLLVVNGTVIANVTGLSFDVAGGHSVPGGVVGSNLDPAIFPGTLGVTGSVTALFSDTVNRDAFINETEATLVMAFTGSNAPDAPAIGFVMSRIKYSGNTKDDGAAGISETMPFTALENVNGGVGTAFDATTIAVQDTSFV
jgi:hypothetical protein